MGIAKEDIFALITTWQQCSTLNKFFSVIKLCSFAFCCCCFFWNRFCYKFECSISPIDFEMHWHSCTTVNTLITTWHAQFLLWILNCGRRQIFYVFLKISGENSILKLIFLACFASLRQYPVSIVENKSFRNRDRRSLVKHSEVFGSLSNSIDLCIGI